jgi:hypothetical protein
MKSGRTAGKSGCLPYPEKTSTAAVAIPIPTRGSYFRKTIDSFQCDMAEGVELQTNFLHSALASA